MLSLKATFLLHSRRSIRSCINNHTRQITSSRSLSSSLPSSGSGKQNDPENKQHHLPATTDSSAHSNDVNIISSPSSIPIEFSISSKIEGEESQIATITLKSGETLRAESGSMLYMTQGVEMATSLQCTSSAFQRMMTGQNVFLTDFTYNIDNDNKRGEGTVALGTDFPSKIIRLSLDDYSGRLIAQRGAYLASNPSVDIQMEFTKRMTAGFFGGQGFILQRLIGEGDVLIKAGGTLVERYLDDGEVLRVSSGSISCFETSISYDVQMMQGVKNVMFGGEGLFITTLTGPGRVWMQGMTPDRMIAEIAARVPAGSSGFGPIIPMPIGGMGVAGDTGGGEAEGTSIDGAAGVPGDVTGNPDVVDSENEQDTTDATDSATTADDPYANTNIDDNNNFQEITFTNDSFDETAFAEPTLSDNQTTSFSTNDDEGIFGQQDGSGDLFDDSTEILDTGFSEAPIEEAAEAGSSILSTLWDIFTGGD
jgi:uncharacterized protein (TIGR00266 family)